MSFDRRPWHYATRTSGVSATQCIVREIALPKFESGTRVKMTTITVDFFGFFGGSKTFKDELWCHALRFVHSYHKPSPKVDNRGVARSLTKCTENSWRIGINLNEYLHTAEGHGQILAFSEGLPDFLIFGRPSRFPGFSEALPDFAILGGPSWPKFFDFRHVFRIS